MATVYVLINRGWEDISDSGSERDSILGIFSSKELIIEAANNYLNNTDWGSDEEYIMLPIEPISFEQLKDGYEFLNYTDYYGASLCVYTYEIDADMYKPF